MANNITPLTQNVQTDQPVTKPNEINPNDTNSQNLTNSFSQLLNRRTGLRANETSTQPQFAFNANAVPDNQQNEKEIGQVAPTTQGVVQAQQNILKAIANNDPDAVRKGIENLNKIGGNGAKLPENIRAQYRNEVNNLNNNITQLRVQLLQAQAANDPALVGLLSDAISRLETMSDIYNRFIEGRQIR